MARIQEEVIVITLSKLHKNEPNGTVTDIDIVDDVQIKEIESVLEQMLESDIVVEVSKA